MPMFPEEDVNGSADATHSSLDEFVRVGADGFSNDEDVELPPPHPASTPPRPQHEHALTNAGIAEKLKAHEKHQAQLKRASVAHNDGRRKRAKSVVDEEGAEEDEDEEAEEEEEEEA